MSPPHPLPAHHQQQHSSSLLYNNNLSPQTLHPRDNHNDHTYEESTSSSGTTTTTTTAPMMNSSNIVKHHHTKNSHSSFHSSSTTSSQNSLLNRCLSFSTRMLILIFFIGFLFAMYSMLRFHGKVISNKADTSVRNEFITKPVIERVFNGKIDYSEDSEDEKNDGPPMSGEAINFASKLIGAVVTHKDGFTSVVSNGGGSDGSDGRDGSNTHGGVVSDGSNTSVDQEDDIETGTMFNLVCNVNKLQPATVGSKDQLSNKNSLASSKCVDCNKIQELKGIKTSICKPSSSGTSFLKCIQYDAFTKLCQANNLIINLSKIRKVSCLRYRNENCAYSNSNSYYSYDSKAYLLDCDFDYSKFTISSHSKDFQKDIFASFSKDTNPEETESRSDIVKRENEVSILVFRENGPRNEIENIFYVMSELYNTYLLTEVFDLNWKHLDIVFMDDHKPSKFDILWKSLFKSVNSMSNIYKEMNQVVRFKHVIFQPSVYASPLVLASKSTIEQNEHCNMKALINNFASILLQTFKIEKHAKRTSEKPLVILALDDEDVKNTLSKRTGIELALQFASLTIKEQLQLATQSSLLIGQGDKLILSLFLPSTSAVIEIQQQTSSYGDAFHSIAEWKGLKFSRIDKSKVLAEFEKLFPDR
ncbi:hypothetical protein C9374_004919 [Naegleria lovaniensis]|uniref:Uncharacterized protein n=1 Tax=Naegleria lovaniensis TaxID=51637 RepID=A0AA88KJ64_NAELO|nr:uncharacterized protein C9374_004919 [Naegleria lovaniensis]KAG2382952.1 hypothetical protein C9374_004919 [Naegleria lovaniensis]